MLHKCVTGKLIDTAVCALCFVSLFVIDEDSAADEDMDEAMEDVEGETDPAASIVPDPVSAPSTKANTASKKRPSPRAQQTNATTTPPTTATSSSSGQAPSQLVSTESASTPAPGAAVSTGAAEEASGATTEPLAGASGSSDVSLCLHFSLSPSAMLLPWSSITLSHSHG